MNLVLQRSNKHACVLACIAMVCDTTLDEVIKVAGTDGIPDPEVVKATCRHLGVEYPDGGYIVDGFGDRSLPVLMSKHRTLMCTVASCLDLDFRHRVVIHDRELYDPGAGMNPSWPWDYRVCAAAPVDAKGDAQESAAVTSETKLLNAPKPDTFLDPDKAVACGRCGFSGKLSEYKPCFGYNDIRCPKCGSTENEHNLEYMRRIHGTERGMCG